MHQGLLSGITVIEIGHSVAAPYAAEILGDLGAEVIKIEKIDGGDDARTWAPPFWAGMSAIFQSLNRHKKSVALDMKSARDKDALKKLILDRADVVIQNMRPGTVERLGLDGQTLCRLKPSLVYCSIGAFGAIGPLKDRPGYDPLMQAFAGMMSVTGEPGGAPVRVGTSIIDMGAGMWSVIGIQSALLRRTATGQGAIIDTSLYETALAWMTYHAATFQASGKVPQRMGSGSPQIVPYRGFHCADGFILILAGNDKLFGLVANILGAPEWIADPRFRNNAARVENQSLLYPLMSAIVSRQSTAYWQERLDDAGVPNSSIQDIQAALSHPQTQALGMMQTSPKGDISLLGLPLSFDGHRPPFRMAAPALGAHTEEIMGWQRADE